MNKNAELAILDEAIAKLGRNSYLGPWLADVRSFVELDVRSDLPVTYTLKEHAEIAARIIKSANDRAAEIVANAEKNAANANRELAKAQENARRLRNAIDGTLAILKSTIIDTY